MKSTTLTRTGFGFDSHLFSKSGKLILGGFEFKNLPSLKGHSDGDALLHAVIDALLGAACAGDIGQLFSDRDPALKGISSRVMLDVALQKIRGLGFRPIHIDITVMADRPKLSPVSVEMRKILASLLSLPLNSVSLKAKTAEGLNFFKSPGGIAVWAVATVIRHSGGGRNPGLKQLLKQGRKPGSRLSPG